MAATAYGKIELHEVVTFYTTCGLVVSGEVVGKDEEWLTICDSESNEPLCIARRHICAFRVHIHN